MAPLSTNLIDFGYNVFVAAQKQGSPHDHDVTIPVAHNSVIDDWQGYEPYGLLDIRKRGQDPTDFERVVSPFPTSLKAVVAVLGTVGFIVILGITWRARLWYRRRRMTRSSTPSWGSIESEKLAELKTLSLVKHTSRFSVTSESKPTYQSGKWVPQTHNSPSSRTIEKVPSKYTAQVQSGADAFDGTRRIQDATAHASQPKPPEPLIRHLSRKLSARRPSRPLPKPPLPTAASSLPSPSFEKVLDLNEPRPPPRVHPSDRDIEVVDLLPPPPHLTVKTVPLKNVAASLVLNKQVSANATSRVIPPAPSTIPTGPLPSIPIAVDGTAPATSIDKSSKGKTKHRPPHLPITTPASTKIQSSQRKTNRTEVKSTVTTVSQTPRSTHAFLNLPPELQPEKSPARSDSFKAVVTRRVHSRERVAEASAYERTRLEQEILEMLNQSTPSQIAKKRKKKVKKADREPAPHMDPMEPSNPPQPPRIPIVPKKTNYSKSASTSSSERSKSPRLPRLVTVHKLYRPSLQDELHIELDEPLRLLAEFMDGWVAVERVSVKIARPQNLIATPSESTPTTSSDINFESELEPERGVIPRFCILDRAEFVGKAKTVGSKAIVKEVQRSVRSLKGMSWSSGFSTRKGGKKVPFGYGEMQGVKR